MCMRLINWIESKIDGKLSIGMDRNEEYNSVIWGKVKKKK